VADAEEFADESLQAFGLNDAPGLRGLAQQLKTSTSGRADIPMDLLASLTSLTSSELFTHLGTHASSEAVHIKPIIGQLLSAGTGYAMMRKRLLSIIEKSRTVAGEIHEGILIPVVIHNNQLVDPSRQTVSLSRGSAESLPPSTSTRMATISPPPILPPPPTVALNPKATTRSVPLIRDIARNIFQACVSVFALLTLLFCFAIMKDDNPGKYVVISVTGLIIGLLMLKVRTFRVMLLTNLATQAILGLCYIFGFEEVEENKALAFLVSTGSGMSVLSIST
jgi:hypothetical protein